MRKNEDADLSSTDDIEEDVVQQDEEDEEAFEDADEKQEKKYKTGILYIPTIPPYMTVTILREMLGEFGEIGRVYLQEDKNVGKNTWKLYQ
jgi:ESF2/ABP1 family protein